MPDLPEKALDYVAAKTKGFTPAEIVYVIQELNLQQNSDPTAKDVDKLISKIKERRKIGQRSFFDRFSG